MYTLNLLISRWSLHSLSPVQDMQLWYDLSAFDPGIWSQTIIHLVLLCSIGWGYTCQSRTLWKGCLLLFRTWGSSYWPSCFQKSTLAGALLWQFPLPNIRLLLKFEIFADMLMETCLMYSQYVFVSYSSMICFWLSWFWVKKKRNKSVNFWGLSWFQVIVWHSVFYAGIVLSLKFVLPSQLTEMSTERWKLVSSVAPYKSLLLCVCKHKQWWDFVLSMATNNSLLMWICVATINKLPIEMRKWIMMFPTLLKKGGCCYYT